MGSHVPCSPPLVAPLLALLALLRMPDPDLVLHSEHRFPQFGVAMAASTDRVATIDGTADALILRIDRVAGRRVEPEARLSLGSSWKVPAIELRGDTAVVNLPSGELRFYTARKGTWSLAQAVTLPARCTDSYFDAVHLGDDVLVVEARQMWCVFERAAKGWALGTTIPHEPSTAITTSRDRILIVGASQAIQLERSSGHWKQTRTIAAPDDAQFDPAIAAGDRWLVLRDSEHRLRVYDLDAAGAQVAVVVPPGGREATWFAVGQHAIAASDDIGAIAWRFADRSWRWLDEGLDGDYHPPVVADLIWIGDPAKAGGRIHGFLIE